MKTNPLIQAEFRRAWNEWIHGHDTKAAEIWYEILRKYPESGNDQITIDVVNFLAMYERIWEGRMETEIDIIRNKQKIMATINNAEEFMRIAEEHGSFQMWLDRLNKENNYEYIRKKK